MPEDNRALVLRFRDGVIDDGCHRVAFGKHVTEMFP
jgi:hypothetical protein